MKKTFVGIFFTVCTLFIFIRADAAPKSYDGYIVRLKNNCDTVMLSSLNDYPYNGSELEVINAENRLFHIDDINNLPEYISEEDIEHIEPDYDIYLFDTPNDSYASAWFMKNIHASAAWETGCHGEDIRIAVIDSGVSKHNDITKNLVEGYNFINNTKDTTDTYFHGTFVSGIIAAQANNSFALAGLAYNAKIVPLKCFDGENSQLSYMIKAIYAAVNTYNCKVLNISAGTEQYSSELENAVKYAVSKGAVVVAASGNHDNKKTFNCPYYPASFDCVVSVGSVNQKNNISYFSNYNEYVDIVAPGESIVSLANDSDSGLKQASGTSFAAPFVSAAAAICLNINPDITYSDFLTLLEQASVDLGDEGKDIYYGNGLLNMENIVDKLLEGKDFFVSPFDFESDSPSAVVYNNTDSEQNVFSIWSQEYTKQLEKLTLQPKSGAYICLTPSADSFTNYIWSMNLKPLKKTVYYTPPKLSN